MMKKARVTATLYVGRECWRMDDDNAVARLKWPLDLCKRQGLIYDDKRPYVQLTGIPEQVTVGEDRFIEMTLEEILED